METPAPTDAPVRLWLLPHPRRERGEPAVRPLLCDALGCDDDALPLTRGESGRPHLGAPYQRFDAGWSHSGDALLLALGDSVRLGVDIEQVRPRPRVHDLARRFFDPRETQWLLAQDEAELQRSFVRLWCAKEAVLKTHGQGISFGLEKLVFEDTHEGLRLVECDAALGLPHQWHLREWAPLQGYRAALAWRAA